MPAEAVERIRDHGRGALTPYETGDGLEIPRVSLVASARRDEWPGPQQLSRPGRH